MLEKFFRSIVLMMHLVGVTTNCFDIKHEFIVPLIFVRIPQNFSEMQAYRYN